MKIDADDPQNIELKQLEKEISILEKKLDISLHAQNDNANQISILKKICEKNTSKAFIHLIALRALHKEKGFLSETLLQKARKTFSLSISIWEKKNGHNLKSFQEPRNKTLLQLFPNEKIVEQFRLITLGLDWIFQNIKEKSKWAWVLVEMKERALINSINLLDIRSLFKEQADPLHPNFAKANKALAFIGTSIEDCIKENWNKYVSKQQEQENPYEINKAIQFLEIGEKIAILLGNFEKKELYQKKIKVWNKYLAKIKKK